MTLPSTQNTLLYAGDGSTTVFPFPFYFLDNADLRVVLRDNTTGVDTSQVLNTHYSVTGAGVPAGGSVTMVVAPASGKTLIISRDPPITQQTDYVPNDPFPAESHERALDKGAMISQALRRDVDGSIRVAFGETLNRLPAASARALKFPFFDASGQPTVVDEAGFGDTLFALVSFADRAALAAASVNTVATKVLFVGGYAAFGDGGHGWYEFLPGGSTFPAAEVIDALGQVWRLLDLEQNVLQFGADKTATSNSSPAFQSAVEFTVENNRKLRIPAGTYRIDTRIVHVASAAFKNWMITGDGVHVTRIQVSATNTLGWLSISMTGNAAEGSTGTIRDLHVEPMGPGCGTAISVTTTGAPAALNTRTITLENVRVAPLRNTIRYFNVGLDLTNCGRPLLFNVRVLGVFGTDPAIFNGPPLNVVSYDTVADTVTITGHGYIEGDKVVYRTNGGTNAGGLIDGDTYWVRNPTANTFQLSILGPISVLIDITSSGTGTHTFEVEDETDTANKFNMDVGVVLDDTYNPTVNFSECIGAKIGWRSNGAGQEGATFIGVVTVTKIGIQVRRNGQQPTMRFIQCHTHYRDVGIELNGTGRSAIFSSDFSQSVAAQHAPSAPVDLLLINTSRANIISNTHVQIGDPRRRYVRFDGVTLGGVLADQNADASNIVIFSPIIDARAAVGFETLSAVRCVVDMPTYTASGFNNTAIKYSDDNDGLTVIERASDTAGKNSVRIISFSDAAGLGPTYDLVRDSASPAAADNLGIVRFFGRNDVGEEVLYADIRCIAGAVTDGAEASSLILRALEAGALAKVAGNGGAAIADAIVGTEIATINSILNRLRNGHSRIAT